MTLIYILLGVSLAVGVLSAVLCFVLLKKLNKGADVLPEKFYDDLKDSIRTASDMSGERVVNQLLVSNSAMLSGVTAHNQAMEKNVKDMLEQSGKNALKSEENIAKFMQTVEYRLDRMRDEITKNLTEVKENNSKQLDKMRETVEEKLSTTLETRFNASFKLISTRLEEINKSFLEMHTLQAGVSDLNKFFGNVKNRGVWGEISLENLLSQMLTPDQYEKQLALGRGSDLRVDFAVRLPGKNTEAVYLPIDAKFPTESYQRLVDASEKGDAEQTNRASKEFLSAIDTQARSIRDKYIKPPKTTDFAVIYLPVEGMFAEVVKSPGMQEKLQRNYRIVVAGPTTLAALLNSLQMGFRTVALEKRNAEIRKLFESFTKDFNTFSELLSKTHKKLGEISTTIEKASKRTESIKGKLAKVADMPVPEETALLEDGGKKGAVGGTGLSEADDSFELAIDDGDSGDDEAMDFDQD